MQRLRIISLGVCWIAVLGVAPSLEAADAAYTLVPDAHGMVLKSPGGRVVFRYMTKKPAKTNLAASSVCCFHPLNTPSGVRVTDLAPGDTVGEYLTDYPNDRVRNEVTIEQLLNHRSGFGDMFTREYMETPMQS